MDLIDRYVHEVGRHLPRSLRADVEQELRSNLEEGLDGLMSGGDWESKEDAAVSLLKDLGSPRGLATSYRQGPQHLIGPDLFPAFIFTLKLCAGLLVGLLALVTGIEIVSFGGGLSQIGHKALGMIDGFFDLAILFFGIIVIVFAIIERTSSRTTSETADFDPRELPRIDDPDRIQPLGQVVKIVLMIVGLVVLNFFLGRIGSYVTIGEESGWIPILGEAFTVHLPLINLAIILELALNGFVLARGRWQTLTRWLEVGVNLISLAVLFRLGFGPDVVAIDPQWMIDHGWSRSAADWYQEFAQDFLAPGVSLALKVAFVAVLVGTVVSLFKLFKRLIGAAA